MRARRALLAVAVLALPAQGRAQDEPAEAAVQEVSRVTPAAYVSDGRRDPFLPLTGVFAYEEEGAPRLEQLELTGIFVGAPGNSLAVLEDPARRGHFVRVGESVGNARLVEIMPDAAVFEVDDYGIQRRDTLRLVPDRPAATSRGSQPAPSPPEDPEREGS